MRDRALGIAWIAVAVVAALLLLYELNKWRSISTEGARAASERVRLTSEIRAREGEIVKEMRANAGLLQEMQWSSAGGDPSAFLTRLADLAREKRMKIVGIGNLERQATAQFSKSWHTIQVVAPYRELRELAARVEGEKGVLEDMLLTVPRDTGAPGAAKIEEVEAKFRMTGLELTAEAKRILDRALAASGAAAQPPAPAPSLALPVPGGVADAGPTRDPFAFGALPAVASAGRPGTRPAGGAAPAPAPPPEAPKVAMELKGIVSFPGGFLAIVNNQIVKVGDSVSGHRVDRITEDTVVLREPGGGTRTVTLPGVAAAPPAGIRR